MKDRYEKIRKINRDKYVGKVFPTKNCGDIEVTGYTNNNTVDIVFLKTGYRKVVGLQSILKGGVKDPYSPFVYEVGFFGVGNYTSRNSKGKDTKAYKKWHSMLERCYSDKWLSASKNRNYIGCSVCEEWHNFQNFAVWFYLNYIESYELDKDKKVKGNKVYSPETCIFISKADNVEVAFAKEYVLVNPEGEKVCIYNMNKFCRENYNVELSGLRKLALGHTEKYKGWTRYE